MPISKTCVFIGYPFGQKGYKVLDMETKEIYVSKDIKFIEHVFPLQHIKVNIVQHVYPPKDIIDDQIQTNNFTLTYIIQQFNDSLYSLSSHIHAIHMIIIYHHPHLL